MALQWHCSAAAWQWCSMAVVQHGSGVAVALQVAQYCNGVAVALLIRGIAVALQYIYIFYFY